MEEAASAFRLKLQYLEVRDAKMQGALTKEGLTEESYSQIFEIARADEGLRKKLVDLINEERQKS